MIGRTISHYKITEKLGEGGMGVGYRGRGRTFTAMALVGGSEFRRDNQAADGRN